MKKFISLFTIAISLVMLNSCRQDEELPNNQSKTDVGTTPKMTEKIEGSTIKDTLQSSIEDPPIKDGQQWKIEN